MREKFGLYQDVLKVREYFLFDPHNEYLKPPLQGYRLRKGRYGRIRPVKGRLPSHVLGLHLERNGKDLRLYDPAAGQWLPTHEEILAQIRAETEELLREAEALRRRLPKGLRRHVLPPGIAAPSDFPLARCRRRRPRRPGC